MNRASVLMVGLLAASTQAADMDMTTYSFDLEPETRVLPRYIVNIANTWGETTRQRIGPTGIVEYFSNVQGGVHSWWVNDGDWFTYTTTDGGLGTDFGGYRFKLRAKRVSSIHWVNRVFWDGGTFAGHPAIQYLTEPGGMWQTVPAQNVTWDGPYDPSFPHINDPPQSRPYHATLNPPLTDVWGVRMYGNATVGLNGDPDGFVSFAEITIHGEPDLGGLDLGRNLALGATGIMSNVRAASGEAADLTNGELDWYEEDAVDSKGGVGTEEYMGAMWEQPQFRVGAIGVILRWFGDGGFYKDGGAAPLRVEYTTTATLNPAAAAWLPVTGLDKGRYPTEWSNLAAGPDVFWHVAFLFRFDPLDGITGLRIIGAPAGGGTGDPDGYVGAYEIEVFGVPTLASRLDHEPDGDIDRDDAVAFGACMLGAHIPIGDPQCATYDLDNDGDVDQADYATFQLCFSGKNVPPVGDCGL